jgi:Na+/H+ antiporter NhaD/arsenite permease-like protein
VNQESKPGGLRRIPGKIAGALRRNLMLSVSLVAAAATLFFVPPDRAYLGYFDVKTLVCLLGVLVVVRALSATGLLTFLSAQMVALCGNLRAAVGLLMLLTLAGSLLITNDMALIAFLPLGYHMLRAARAEEHLAFVFILQTMAANLGGMLTPFGNPQNLYLYTFYNIETSAFFRIMLPPFAVSVGLTLICCLFVKPVKIPEADRPPQPDMGKVAIYLALFALVILAIFRVLPYPVALAAPVGAAFLDRKALKEADYPLILTFCAFFVFSGNLARIPAVESFLGGLVSGHTTLVAAGVSQIISNVPAAILLSKFTDAFAPLLVGVNIGGAGTPVASLASLITIRHFMRYQPSASGRFGRLYLALNAVFLAVLLILFART